MLSRSGFSIRKFVRQTPRTSLDSDDSGSVDGARPRATSNDEQSEKPKVAKTWRRTKRPPPPILVIRRSENIHLISNPLPPLPDTPHSTSSSLCSCEYRLCPKTPASKGSPTLCSIVPNGSPSLSPQLYHNDGKHQHTLYVASDDARKLHHSPPNTITMPDSIEQLIRETNKAFENVGNALDDARIAAQSPVFPGVSRSHGAESPALSVPGLSPSRPSPRASKYPLPLNSPARRASVTKPNRKPAKIGRQKLAQSRQKQHRQQQSQLKALNNVKTSKTPARWTLGENVSELLNSRLFHRIEADEMVTSEQVKEWRQKNPRAEDDRQTEDAISIDSLRIFDVEVCETPVEPFHLEDLPTRIGAAGVRTSMPPLLGPYHDFDFGLDVICEDFSLKKCPPRPQTQPPTPKPKPLSSPQGDENEMTFQDVSFPTPPPKSPLRLNSPHRQLPPLPTIPESASVSPVAGQPRPFQQVRRQCTHKLPEMKQAKVTDEYIYFSATPFSVTMPTYRHGPIRLSRADVRLRSPVQPFVDETLDWTAFQMAILGAPGDFMGDPDDGDDEEQANDLAVWYEGFNIGHEGKMLVTKEEEAKHMVHAEVRPTEKPRIPKAANRATMIILPKPVDVALTVPLPPSPTMIEDGSPGSACPSPRERAQPEMVQIRRIPIPLIIERPLDGGWNARFEFSLGRWVLDAPKEDCEQHQEQPRDKGRQRVGSGNSSVDSSVDSMPQSPMLDLVVSRAVTGEDYVVPMGYNLGHDLGDFLKWEAENVSLAGFRD